MSEQNASLDQLKKTYHQLEFIHQVLTQRTSFNIDEFEIAKDATTTVTDMANKLADTIKAAIEAQEATEALESAVDEVEVTNE